MPKSTKFNGHEGFSVRLSSTRSDTDALNETNNLASNPVVHISDASNERVASTSNNIKRKHTEETTAHKSDPADDAESFWQRLLSTESNASALSSTCNCAINAVTTPTLNNESNPSTSNTKKRRFNQGCVLADKFPPTPRTKENVNKALDIPKEKRVFISLKDKSEVSSMEDSLTVSKVSEASTQSRGKFSAEEVMSRLKGKSKVSVKIEDVTKALDEHLSVTSAVLGKKRKNDDVVITKVVEPPPKVDSVQDSASLKTWDDFTREVGKLGLKFVEDVIARGKQIECEYQIKAFKLNADKMRMEKAMDALKEELRDVQLEKGCIQAENYKLQKSVNTDLIEAQKQVACLSQELAYLITSLVRKDFDHTRAMEVAMQNALDSTVRIVVENRI